MKAARADALAGTSKVGLKSPPCKCKPPVAPVAVVADKQLYWRRVPDRTDRINGAVNIAEPILPIAHVGISRRNLSAERSFDRATRPKNVVPVDDLTRQAGVTFPL